MIILTLIVTLILVILAKQITVHIILWLTAKNHNTVGKRNIITSYFSLIYFSSLSFIDFSFFCA